MASSFSQDNRRLEITTPLGPNVLGLRSIHVREELSAGFTIEAELSSDDPDIKFDSIVGHPVAVRLELGGGHQRYWHALVARFIMIGQVDRFTHYRAVLVPWLWALTRSADCRVFQNKTFPDIVQQVFRDRGAGDFVSNKLTGSYQPSEFCVQYRETDFNFVSRLMEQEGIAYYFQHDDKAGNLVLADEKAGYDLAPVHSALNFHPMDDKDGREDVVRSWVVEQEVQATEYALTDYNPLTPKESLLRTAKVGKAHGTNDRQIFDYPGEFRTGTESERLARIRLDEVQSASEIARAQTPFLGLGAGSRFSLKEHPRSEQNREYLVTSVNLTFDAGEFSSAGGGQAHGTCSFTAIPSAQTYRPPRVTPKPVAQGLQPAVVVGPSGEEIHTDEHGRVKVQFYWDRVSKGDEKASSCWVRIAHGWAGKKMGMFFLPRVGHEVLVEFLEGDPDRPIITGSMHNANNMPPYALPGEKTKTTLKTASSKGGGGFNELRFEDKKGSEQIFIHAEKDQDVRIKNDQVEWVGRDQHLVVKNDKLEHVEHDRHETVDADHVEKIAKDRHLKVGGKEAKEVGGSHSFVVKGDVAEKFSANHSEETTGDFYVKAKNIVLEAGTNLTIKVGGTSIALEATGIGLKTSGEFKIAADSKGEIKTNAPLKIESAATVDVKGAMVTVKADGVAAVKGSVVQVN